jgi:hypothetical protein
LLIFCFYLFPTAFSEMPKTFLAMGTNFNKKKSISILHKIN